MGNVPACQPKVGLPGFRFLVWLRDWGSSNRETDLSNAWGQKERKGDLLKNFYTPDNLSWIWSVIEAKPPE